jgi:predicted  nucleic acid-binding Zn-ribbon protein
MPYKCTQCGAIYMDGSQELQDVVKRGGCACGKRLLMYVRAPVDEIEDAIKKSSLEEKKAAGETIEGKEEAEKKTGEKKEAEKRVPEKEEETEKKIRETKEPETVKKKPVKIKSSSDLDWLDKEFTDKKTADKHVYFDIETVQRIEEGEFELDVGSLMSGKPYVVKAEEGVYYIHVPSAMKKKKEKDEE